MQTVQIEVVHDGIRAKLVELIGSSIDNIIVVELRGRIRALVQIDPYVAGIGRLRRLLANQKVFLAVVIPITDEREAVIVDMYISAVCLNMTCVCQSGTGFDKKCQISVSVSGNEIALAVFVPVADRDCSTLASTIWQIYGCVVRLQKYESAKCRVRVFAHVFIIAYSPLIELADYEVFFRIAIPVVGNGRTIQSHVDGRGSVIKIDAGLECGHLCSDVKKQTAQD